MILKVKSRDGLERVSIESPQITVSQLKNQLREEGILDFLNHSSVVVLPQAFQRLEPAFGSVGSVVILGASSPEYQLLAQYHDPMDTIRWVKNQATNPKGEQWLREYRDFSRCYLYGCENGINMVLSMGIRARASL